MTCDTGKRMMKKKAVIPAQVSEIFSSYQESEDATCYLGFTISYPDGRIENVTMEYQREEFEQAIALMKIRRARAIKNIHSRR